METLDDLGQAIDKASDTGNEAALGNLAHECEKRLDFAVGSERVILLYYKSNAYAGIVNSKTRDFDYVWSWNQPDSVKNLLELRRAVKEPNFNSVDPIRRCQIYTSIANRLNSLGRPIAANDYWLQALEIIPLFAKALINRANCLSKDYARMLYDGGHQVILLSAARSLFDAALGKALWESGDREDIAPWLEKTRRDIEEYLSKVEYKEDFELNQWSLGDTEEERLYRGWCLDNRLFLNPINDALIASVAATDVLHLPSHAYNAWEAPRYPLYYNLMKQEYISARYRLYRVIHEQDPEFTKRDVAMLDSGEGQALGHYTEDIKAAFRSSYSIFDKVSLFLNDYYNIGATVAGVNFRSIWYENYSSSTRIIRPVFETSKNWPLRGLYFLSKDLFDANFVETAEPDAKELLQLRNQIEHRFLSLQNIVTEKNSDIHQFISLNDLIARTLRLLRMARESLIYTSLAMHVEENLRNEFRRQKGNKLTP